MCTTHKMDLRRDLQAHDCGAEVLQHLLHSRRRAASCHRQSHENQLVARIGMLRLLAFLPLVLAAWWECCLATNCNSKAACSNGMLCYVTRA
jgi:hypothetical protein